MSQFFDDMTLLVGNALGYYKVRVETLSLLPDLLHSLTSERAR